MEIKPKLTIDTLDIENGKDVVFTSDPYKVELPKEKAFGNPNVWMIDMMFEGIEHQFIAEARSFRYQLAVLKEKLGLGKLDSIIGLKVKIWKTKAHIKNFGLSEVYSIKAL